jgi:UDP-3-O-[3-hydroxymyristoyl] glucosamine N-acyltransferase
MRFTLAELAQRFGLELKGDGGISVGGVCTLQPGEPGCIAFLANPKYRSQLGDTLASAVILGRKDVPGLKAAGLVAADPYLAFARIAKLFDTARDFAAGVHPSATVAAGASIEASAHVGAQAVIETGAHIASGAFVGPGCVVGEGSVVGAGTRLEARVWIGPRVRIGERCRFNPGAVIGGRGFGLARGPAGWEEVPQLGGVVIGNDVEVGSNTCIDRGAIGDTVIEDGVKLDNLIQVAHNVRIGAQTAIAANVGIAGSTRIGRRCMIGGGAGFNGHIEIADDVIVLGYAMVTESLPKKGVYGSGLPVQGARDWRKSVARIHRLGHLDERLKAIEKHLKLEHRDDADEPDNAGEDS